MAIHSQFTGLELHEAFHFVQESDPGAVGAGLYWLKVSTGSLKKRTADNTDWVSIGGGGVSAFTSLSDVPNSYSGQALKKVRVNAGATGLEFVTDTTPLPNWLALRPDATPASPSAKDDEFDDSAKLPGGGSAIWSWFNQSGFSATINGTHLVLAAVAGSTLVTALMQPVASAPYTIICKVSILASVANYMGAGLFLHDTGSGKLKYFVNKYNSGWAPELTQFNNVSSFNATLARDALSNVMPATIYLKIIDDNTNLKYQWSLDGVTYLQLYSEARTTFFTPNRFGICLYQENASNPVTGDFDFFRVS